MEQLSTSRIPGLQLRNALVLLRDGTEFWGNGFGAEGARVAELCFNTSMSGYQEILTDPSYSNQVVCFTFPHIGNVGTNLEDDESPKPVASGAIVRWPPTAGSNWRSSEHLNSWMKRHGLVGIGGVDTRRITRSVRNLGAPDVVVAHSSQGKFDIPMLRGELERFSGIAGKELALDASVHERVEWDQSRWIWPSGYSNTRKSTWKVAAVDYGAKRNIFRCLVDLGCKVRVFSANSSAEQILDFQPDGLFLSNGPGDPKATGEYAVPMIQKILHNTRIPIFGICLGHQLLGLALGAKTEKMKHGHHGANHPVKELKTGKVEITSMNHGFMLDRKTFKASVEETHVSLFDGSNCGIGLKGRNAFSVQFHPEASPGPQDSFYLFKRFHDSMG